MEQKYLLGFVTVLIIILMFAVVFTAADLVAGEKYILEGTSVTVDPHGPEDAENVTCIDSDNGKNYYVKGNASYCPPAGQGRPCTMGVDYCSGNDTLREYYCDSSRVRYIDYNCPSGCKDGICSGSENETENQTCIEEGQKIDIMFGPRLECCEGLAGVPDLYFNEDVDKCEVGGDEVAVCVKCGNGECGPGENMCNCPEDCSQLEITEQITEINCGPCNPCPEGLECYNFPGIGSRCAEPEPCSYFTCPSEVAKCIVVQREMAALCPDGTSAAVTPEIRCRCIGAECPTIDGGNVVSYNITARKEVWFKKGNRTVPTKVSIWKMEKTSGYKGIMETPSVSVKITNDVNIKGSKLMISTSAGEKEVNVLPEDAVAASETPKMEKVRKIELGEDSGRPVYSVKGLKMARLLGLLPIKLEIETKIDAETGKKLSVVRPWWSFLVW